MIFNQYFYPHLKKFKTLPGIMTSTATATTAPISKPQQIMVHRLRPARAELNKK